VAYDGKRTVVSIEFIRCIHEFPIVSYKPILSVYFFSVTTNLRIFQEPEFDCLFLCTVNQGQLQRWTEHSTLIFENLKPVEIIKKLFQHHLNILKNFKIRRVWFKNKACHAHFSFDV
jgi:hypothetical protein